MPTITRIKQNDTAPAFSATLLDSAGNAVNLSGATGLFLLKHTRTRELKVSSAIVIVSAVAGTVRYDWVTGDTDTPGDYDAEVQITFSDTTIETFPNGDYHRLIVLKDLGP